MGSWKAFDQNLVSHSVAHHLAAIAVNQVHPAAAGAPGTGEALLAWLADRDAKGLAHLRQLMADGTPIAELPLLATPPTGLPVLSQ